MTTETTEATESKIDPPKAYSWPVVIVLVILLLGAQTTTVVMLRQRDTTRETERIIERIEEEVNELDAKNDAILRHLGIDPDQFDRPEFDKGD